MLDFWYATGLRPSEMVDARLGGIEHDAQGDDWLHVIGKGSKHGKVALPLLNRGALDQYLAQRGLPVTRSRWNPKTALFPAWQKTAPASVRRACDRSCAASSSTPCKPWKA